MARRLAAKRPSVEPAMKPWGLRNNASARSTSTRAATALVQNREVK